MAAAGRAHQQPEQERAETSMSSAAGRTPAGRERAPASAAPSGEHGHGRSAETPSQIPARGWKDILKRCYERLTRDRIVAIAAGVTFYALLAIFPAIAALVAIYGLFADPGTIAQHLDDMASVMPGGAIDVIREQLTSLTSHGKSSLGFAFAIGLGISLWSANSGVKALLDALNVAYAEDEKRSFFRLNAVSLAFTLGGLVAVLIGLGVIVAVPLIVQYLGLPDSMQWIVALVKWLLTPVAVSFAISILYRYGPSRREAKWRWITWGSVLATILWIVVSVLFSWYAQNFGSYNKTYGSLGAVIGFMTWMWLSTVVILLGAELNAEIERQTERDTTVDGPKPIGRRSATVADPKGAAKS
jgi:membrane protein